MDITFKLFAPLRNFFRKPSVHEVVRRQINETHHLLLSHQASAEYHAKMVEYCEGTIDRLNSFTTRY